MRILFIVPSYVPAYCYGGPIHSISALGEALASAGHSVTVLTTDANGPENLKVPLNTTVEVNGVSVMYFHRMTGDHSHFSPALLWFLWKQLPSFDVIHIQSWWNLVAVPAAWISHLRHVTPIISPRGSVTAYTLSHGRTLAKRILHSLFGRRWLKASYLHATTEREQKEMNEILKGCQSMIIPNVYPFSSPVPGQKKDSTSFKVLFLGRIDPVKNLEVVMDAFSTPFSFQTELWIAGNGVTKYKERLQHATENIPSITWLGQVDGPDKDTLLASVDVLVLPSYTENYGNVVIEALAQGTPVLVSEGVGLKDFIFTHKLGQIVGNHVQDWRLAIEHLYKDEAFRQNVKSRAPGIIQTHLGVSALVRKYEEMYHAVGKMRTHPAT